MKKIIAVFVNFHSKIKPIGVESIVIDNSVDNRGFAAAANLGIKQALSKKAAKILLVNPDVKITKDQIHSLAKSDADIVSPILSFTRFGKEILDYGGKVNFIIGRPSHFENKQGKIDFVSGACMMIDAKVFKKIGFFDESYFMYFEDVDFCLRAKKAVFKIAVEEDIMVEHQIAEHKFSHDKTKQRYLLTSNDIFIKKWVPWFFKPLCLPYLVFLWLKTII